MKVQVDCPVCGSLRTRRWATITVRRDTSVVWALVLDHLLHQPELRQETRLCRRCGAVFRSPAWDEAELALIYSPEAWQLVEPHRPTGGQALLNNEARRRSIVDTLMGSVSRGNAAAPPAVADIGGRDGFYVAPLLAEGWEVWTVDSAASAMVDPRIRCLPVRLEQAELRQAFDAVVLSHVLEHLVGLRPFLARVREALRPGGIVYAEVPYEAHRILLRGDLCDPTHQVYFARRTLAHLFRASGFTVRRCVRQRSTYDLSELLAIVLVAERSDAAPGRPPRPPGALHALAETVAPSVLAHVAGKRFPRRLRR